MMIFKILLVLFILLSVTVLGFSINGVHAGIDPKTGARPFRQNIQDFKNSGAAWDLYILAMEKFMAKDQNDEHSYYKIAGIHGLPSNASWDGVVGNAGGVGYCEHGSVLFPIWHRPYLALFEEELWTLAQNIAASYPPAIRDAYQEAAISLRVPYWDWSLQPALPDVTIQPSISVNTPSGMMTIDNPLYAYKFHPLNASDLPFLSEYNESVRDPDLKTGVSQDDVVSVSMQNLQSYWHDSIYTLLSSVKDWNEFSNTAGGGANNIELIHGGVHNTVGGSVAPSYGHMTFLWYSAYDPIFWLHHANIDRLVALWQAVNPYSYIEPQASSGASYYYPEGTMQTQTTPLVPFHQDDQGQFHTGESVRDLKAFGYSYPELVYWSETGSNVWTLQKSIIRTVNQLYHPGLSASNTSNTAVAVKHFALIGSSLAADWEYKLKVKANFAFLGKSTAMYFFAGNRTLSSDPADWGRDPSLIGRPVHIHPIEDGMSATGLAPTTISIPLTQALLSCQSLEPETVLAWVNSSMIWRAIDASLPVDFGEPRRPLGPDSKRGLTTSVPDGAIQLDLLGRQVAQPLNDESFPTYSAWKDYGTIALVGEGGRVIIHD